MEDLGSCQDESVSFPSAEHLFNQDKKSMKIPIWKGALAVIHDSRSDERYASLAWKSFSLTALQD